MSVFKSSGRDEATTGLPMSMVSVAGAQGVIQMRELISNVAAALSDIRGLRARRPELYDPESYAASHTKTR